MLSQSLRNVGRFISRARTPAVTARYMSSNMNDHIVIALGGNALLKRGEKMTISNQRQNIRDGMQSLADIVRTHKTTIVHGNGPQ
jgi:hypothetical protein